MTQTSKFNILVVDDSAGMRKLLRRILQVTGLRCGTIFGAGDGEEALQILHQERIGFVMTDIHMPRMNGWQLLSALQQVGHRKQIPVLVITNEGAPTKQTRALTLAAAGYLRKPFTAEQVQEQIKNILGSTSACRSTQDLTSAWSR